MQIQKKVRTFKKYTKHLFSFSILSVVVFLVSCSQKYDETGIFDPQDPNFSADTLNSPVRINTVIFSKNTTYDNYTSDDLLYLGKDSTLTDSVTANAKILFKISLPDTVNLDTADVVFTIVESANLDTNKQFDIYRVNGDWNSQTMDSTSLDFTYLRSKNLTQIDSTHFQIRISFDGNEIREWAREDTLAEKQESFLLKCSDPQNISPIVKMYSSHWSSSLQLQPYLNSYYSYLDSLGILQKDSVLNDIADDITLAYKKSEVLNDTSKFKLGGISGESYICKFDLSQIRTDATVITGRMVLSSILDEVDPVYGNFSNDENNINNSSIYKPQIFMYAIKDTMWYSSGEFEYDTQDYVYEYETNSLDSTNYFNMDRLIQYWIKYPETNFGLLITTKNWTQPFGYSVFRKPIIQVSYITLTDTE
ncbi:MAG: hypothetical protein JXR69_06245 [Candidatus Delongbacteria bacterium]|nr:hypothetical protein [Candidatus Delongbacteria bacterium]